MARGSKPAPKPRKTVLTHTIADFEPAFWPDEQPVDNAVVMTMGALHEGHAALIRAARKQVGKDGRVAVTVFVNPLQFDDAADLERYPKTLAADVRVAEENGADVVFAPLPEEMYPNGTPVVRLSAGPMGERFEGAARPGHFDGMLTVVAKLLHITDPDFAFFGEKDAQQLALIQRMVADLDFDVEIVGVPTVREEDGLALSSRNRFLSEAERTQALALSRALFAGRDAAAKGPQAVREAAAAVLDGAQGLSLDYLALIDPDAFTEAPDDFQGEAVLAVAAKVGATRLIDNVRMIVR
ncbi:pantothenate synthetase [Kitasatospora sp. MMS16-BH015]|uniref:pantoate--beta-alanine ligase n=1 Tax=Kitasatospora sp. MMS16-BH015 TaxID=2018025 RepID=UPI000CA0EEE9|nr:pantoate--beta-alanine ligase [Kitasatospora sp. MMS16-BH015]AUG77992.1 pantothenate synthetase [Kitasatospora sp. MMS16-BH015]